MKPERIVFMGTPEFAVSALNALAEEGWPIVGVVSQPDQPKGRGKRLQPTPVKVRAEELGLPVLQRPRIRGRVGVAKLKEWAPDLLVTAAFGQILSQEILDLPRLGCINVHASLLPEYRGAAPVQWAVLDGRSETGVTTMLTDIGIDTGPMLLQKRLKLDPMETTGTLFERLAALGAQTLKETMRALAEDRLEPVAQHAEAASYARMLTHEDEWLDWRRPAEELCRWVRGLSPTPGACSELAGVRFKLYLARPVEGQGASGEVLCASAKEGLIVAAGAGAVEVLELQAPGGKRMTAKAYLAGRSIALGACFGGGKDA